MGYFLYKGLKKPLIFFGLKDKYIYYAMTSAITGIILIAIFSSLFGILGLICGLILGSSGVYFSYKLQERKGLYSKTKNENELHIIASRFKNLRFNKKSTHEIQEKNI